MSNKEYYDFDLDTAAIKAIGIGDAGGLPIQNMRNRSNIGGVEFHNFIENNFRFILKDCHLLFLIADMSKNGKTADFFNVAETAKKLGILTISVITVSSNFDDTERLLKVSDSVIAIQNKPIKTTNDLQLEIIQCISSSVSEECTIGIDLLDLKSIFQNTGLYFFGIGFASGENRVNKATQSAIFSLLKNNSNIFQQAHGVLVNISGENLNLCDLDEPSNIIYTLIGENTIMRAVIIEKNLGLEIKVAIIVSQDA